MSLCRMFGKNLQDGAANEQHGAAAQRALRAIHDAGFLHGDLSSSNVMLLEVPSSASTVRLLDLGSCGPADTMEQQRAEELQLAALFARKVAGVRAVL